MKKVLIYGMTNNRGGMEAYVMNLYRHMDHTRLQFDFVVDFSEMAYADEVIACGSRIHYIPSKSSSPIGHLRAFSKILKEHPEYDTVYFNILNAGAAFTMMAVRHHKRKIVVHSHNGSDDKMWLHKLFLPLLQRLSDYRLACSAVAAEFMFGTTENVRIVNNAITLQDFSFSPQVRAAKRRTLGLTDDALTVLHVGRIAAQKNPLFVIRVFEEVLRMRPDAHLVYVGAGDMELEVKALAAELGLDDHVHFLGMRSDVDELYNAADVFFLPSLYEGLPIVLVEAQANGLPCLASTNVSADAAITSQLSYIDLDESAENWAKGLIAAAMQGRQNTLAQMESAGYSIDKTVSDIQELLLRRV